jgi:hypothetical protein
VRSAFREAKVSYLQGFFENVGTLDGGTRSVRVPVWKEIAGEFIELLKELCVSSEILDGGRERVMIQVPIEDVMKVPLMSPLIKDGKYYLVRLVLFPAP